MSISQILSAPPVAEGGERRDYYTVVQHGGGWYFIDYSGSGMPSIFECSGESEAFARFDEADAGRHHHGCHCCFDPTAELRRHTPTRSREWK